MKEEIRDVLGFGDQSFKVPMLVYESHQEADKAAGREGALRDEGNNNLLYRGTYAEGRELIVDIVQELTKVPFLTVDTGDKDDKGRPILERDMQKDSDAKYVQRALASTPSVTFEAVQKLITERARGYTYTDPETKQPVKVPPLAADITKRVRQAPKPKTLAAKYKDTAAGIIKANKVAKFNGASAKYGIAAFVPTGDAEKDSVSLGWLCKAYADAKSEEARNEFSA